MLARTPRGDYCIEPGQIFEDPLDGTEFALIEFDADTVTLLNVETDQEIVLTRAGFLNELDAGDLVLVLDPTGDNACVDED